MLNIDQDIENEILVHALLGVSISQTPDIIRYIKNQKVIALVGFGSIHRFNDQRLWKYLSHFVCPMENFEVSVANKGSIYCGGQHYKNKT